MPDKHPFDKLPRQLWLTSQQAARRAVLHYRDDEHFERTQSAVNMGLAAEVLLMAAVATIDTSFLADSTSPTSKLALSRNGNPSGVLQPGEIRTISWEDARKILLAKDSKLGGLADQFKQVMNSRNSAAHIGMTDEGDLGRSVIGLVKIVASLHDHLDFELDDFWGSTVKPMVVEVQDKLTNAVRQSKTAKIINSTKEYEKIAERFTGDSLQAYIDTSNERPLPSFSVPQWGQFEKVVDYECPACSNTGHIFYIGEDDGELNIGYNDMTNDEYVETFIYWAPHAFICQVCNLSLEHAEAELLDGALIDPSQEVFDPDSEHFESLYDRVIREPDAETMDIPSNF